MTYQDAVSIMPTEDRVIAELHAIRTMLQKKGFCAPGEFEGHVVNWAKRTYGMCESQKIGWITMRVCAKYNVTMVDVRHKKNRHEYAHPRQVVMYLGRALTNLSLSQIARYFGLHHTTVMYGSEVVGQRREIDRDLDKFIREISDEFSIRWEAE